MRFWLHAFVEWEMIRCWNFWWNFWKNLQGLIGLENMIVGKIFKELGIKYDERFWIFEIQSRYFFDFSSYTPLAPDVNKNFNWLDSLLFIFVLLHYFKDLFIQVAFESHVTFLKAFTSPLISIVTLFKWR